MKAISSADNAGFRSWLRLAEMPREVREQRRTLAEGIHLAEAIHAAGNPIEALLLRRGADRADVRQWTETLVAAGVPAYELAPSLFDRLSPVERGCGMLLVIPLPEPQRPASGDALFLDGIQDPGNAGALLRVAAAAGVRSVLAAPGTVGLWSPKVLRGAQGAHFRLHLEEDIEASEARNALPVHWIGAAARSGTPLWNSRLTMERFGLMVGSEGAGLSGAAMAACDEHVTIPLASGVESLNVAAAAAICLFERRRQAEALRGGRVYYA
ncbi:MAG TPA: RNA methyltransferase [Burkholderiaceae bacterium]|nr:RNA methyltransferase [Burkholderiaceae bacterium]